MGMSAASEPLNFFIIVNLNILQRDVNSQNTIKVLAFSFSNKQILNIG